MSVSQSVGLMTGTPVCLSANTRLVGGLKECTHGWLAAHWGWGWISEGSAGIKASDGMVCLSDGHQLVSTDRQTDRHREMVLIVLRTTHCLVSSVYNTACLWAVCSVRAAPCSMLSFNSTRTCLVLSLVIYLQMSDCILLHSHYNLAVWNVIVLFKGWSKTTGQTSLSSALSRLRLFTLLIIIVSRWCDV